MFSVLILFIGAASLMLLGFPLEPVINYDETFQFRFLATLVYARRTDLGGEPPETRPLTVSIGVTTYHHGAELLEMTDVADHALYTAKQAGKNRVYSLQYSEVKLSAASS